MLNRVAHVAVLMGGWSTEREVSLCSGGACADALEDLGYRVTRIDVDRNVAQMLEAVRPDIVVNLLHGGVGGNGSVQGLLEVMGIPYTHSGVLAASIATRKDLTKAMLRASGIPVPDGVVASRFDVARCHPIPPPYVIKPLAEGSSLGIVFIMADSDGPAAELASDDWRYGDPVLVEPYIPGKELSCGVVGDRVFDVVETVPAAHFNDHAEKSSPIGSITLLPAPLPPEVYREVQRLSLAAHQALGCRGMSRSDFRYDDSAAGVGGIYCLEVNNQPGMTSLSLLPEMAAYAGVPFKALVQWMVEDASTNR